MMSTSIGFKQKYYDTRSAIHYGVTLEEYYKRIDAGFLPCRLCKKWLPRNDFSPNSTMTRGYAYECKECRRITERKPNSTRKIISPELKREIKENKEGLNGKELAKKYELSETTIYRILDTGRTRAIRERNKEIRRLFESGVSADKLAEQFNLSLKHIWRALKL
jgi:hypothetical protein